MYKYCRRVVMISRDSGARVENYYRRRYNHVQTGRGGGADNII